MWGTYSRGARIRRFALMVSSAVTVSLFLSDITTGSELPSLPAEARCATYFPQEAHINALPRGLLESIAQVETGGAGGRVSADGWPWAIHVNNDGRFFATKAEAVQEAQRLLAQGEDSLDVGCMQVNLHFHPGAFSSLEDAFDPAHNVAYAARFLASLHADHVSWAEAVARYHSADPERGGPYSAQVMAIRDGTADTPVNPSAEARSKSGGDSLVISEAELRHPDRLTQAWLHQQAVMQELLVAGKPSRLARLVVLGDGAQTAPKAGQ
jgi:hypothetical protein